MILLMNARIQPKLTAIVQLDAILHANIVLMEIINIILNNAISVKTIILCNKILANVFLVNKLMKMDVKFNHHHRKIIIQH